MILTVPLFLETSTAAIASKIIKLTTPTIEVQASFTSPSVVTEVERTEAAHIA
jgi:hypothetical protein